MTIIPDKIFIDMDGVLADFDRGVIELCGMQPVPQKEDWAHGEEKIMWERVRMTEHFYDRLEIMPGAKEMFDALYERYGNKVEILSAVPRPEKKIPEAGADKIRWMRRLFPEDLVLNIVQRKEKPLYCSGKGSILIDDFKANVKAWEKCGGTAIYHKSPERTMAELKQIGVL